MLTCATQNKIAHQPLICNLFLPLPDTEFREYLDKTLELARFAPEIITAIDEDLDAHARKKKKLRLADRAFFANQAQGLPKLDIEEREFLSEDLRLEVGRPRMPAEVVFVFLMMRGFLGSLSSKQSWRLLGESMSLYGFFVQRGLKMPGVSTILDNINAVRHQTRELIFGRQIAQILQQELDDFLALTIDSTDDGYSSAKGRDALQSIGVKVISFSGAKGKKLTSSENWESKPYQEARRYRSAVESLMFTIKNGFDFGKLGRRGIEAVRDEQLEKVLAYNCCRSILMEKLRQEKLEKAG